MIQYIIRRSLYAIPIIIGVNLLVFFLFFFVNTPDDIARRQLGPKASPTEIENWKREHNYHLPLVYHDGYDKIASIENRVDANYGVITSNDFLSPGEYSLRFEVLEGNRGDVVFTVRKIDDPAFLSNTRSEGYLNFVMDLRKLADSPKADLEKLNKSKPINFNANYHIDLRDSENFTLKFQEVYTKGFGIVIFVKALNQVEEKDKSDCKVKLELVKFQNDYVPVTDESTIETRGGSDGKVGVMFIPEVTEDEYYLDFTSEKEGPSELSFVLKSIDTDFLKAHQAENKKTENNAKDTDKSLVLGEWLAEYKKTDEYKNIISSQQITDNLIIPAQQYSLTFDNQTQEAFKRFKIVPDAKNQLFGKPAALFYMIKDKKYFPTALKIQLLKVKPMDFAGHFSQTILFQKGLQLLWFDFGKSDNDNIPITYQIGQRMWPSLSLTLPMFIIGLFISVSFSMTLAFFRGTYIDISGTVLCVVIMSINTLFYMILGQLFFAGWLKIFPVSGYDPAFTELWKFVAMPVIIGMVMSLGGNIRFYRTLFLEEINKDYVRTARAKGLGETKVLFKHALKNAMIPILTSVVMSLPFLFMGSLLFENFFSIPGLGSFTIDAILTNDFSIVRAMVYIGSLLYIIGLVMTDISYVLVDPRIKFS